MLTKRQITLINHLINNEAGIKGMQLARLLGVSLRTISNDIEVINSFYTDRNYILSHPQTGYSINREVQRLHESELDNVLTPQERCVYILKKILFSNRSCSLQCLQDELYVSGTTIENDLRHLRIMIKPYDSLSIKRNKNNISIEGSEEEKRQLYKTLLETETKGSFVNLDNLASLFKNFDLRYVKDVLDQTLLEHKYELREVALPMLIIHIGVMLERNMSGYFINEMQQENDYIRGIEYSVAYAFYEKISRKFQIVIKQDEVLKLAKLLIGKQWVNSNSDFIWEYTKRITINQLFEEIWEEINNTYDVDFTVDDELISGLYMHIQSLLERQIFDVRSNNILLPEVKRRYPLIFEIAIKVGSIIERLLNITVDENEVGFIALHLGSAYDRINKDEKYRVGLIYPYDSKLASQVISKLHRVFDERMIVVKRWNFFDEKKVNREGIDLLLTTEHVEHKLPIETIKISYFLSFEDEGEILYCLNRLDKRKFKASFLSQISSLIDAKYFYKDLSLKSNHEVIHYMCQRLHDNKLVDDSFEDLVIQREEMSPTSFAYSFATPHPLVIQSSTITTISIAVLKDRVQWGDYEVKLVILLAINEKDRKILKIFFDWLTKSATNVEKFAKLIEAKNYEDFIETFIEHG